MITFFQQLTSRWKAALLSLERTFDHTYRRLIGVPTLKRSKITPRLFLGGQYSRRGFSILRQRQISAIVSMRMRARKGLPELGAIKLLHLPTPDLHAPTLEQLAQGVTFITEELRQGGKVYVHCAAGEGRGPTMVAAYLISTGLTLNDALAQIRQVRSFIRPTTVQLARLKEWEQKILQNRQH